MPNGFDEATLKEDVSKYILKQEPEADVTPDYINGIVAKYKDPSNLWRSLYKHYYPNLDQETIEAMAQSKIMGYGTAESPGAQTTTNGTLSPKATKEAEGDQQAISDTKEPIERPEPTPEQIASERHKKNLEFKDRLANNEVDPTTVDFYFSSRSLMKEELSGEQNNLIKKYNENYINGSKQFIERRQTELGDQSIQMFNDYKTKTEEQYVQMIAKGEITEEDAAKAMDNDIEKKRNDLLEQIKGQMERELEKRQSNAETDLDKQIKTLNDGYFKPRILSEDEIKTSRDKLFETKPPVKPSPAPEKEFSWIAGVTTPPKEKPTPDFANAVFVDKKMMLDSAWIELKNKKYNEWKDDPEQQYKLKMLDDAKEEFYYHMLDDMVHGQQGDLSVYAIKSLAQNSLVEATKELRNLKKEEEKWEEEERTRMAMEPEPGFTLVGGIGTQPEIRDFPKHDQLNSANASIEKLREVLEHPEEDAGYFSNVAKGMKNGLGLTKSTPYIATFYNLLYGASLDAAQEKAKRGEKLNKSEQTLYDAHGYLNAINVESPAEGYGTGYYLTSEGLAFLGEIAGEMILTGGGVTATRAAFKKGIKEMGEGQLKRILGKEVLGSKYTLGEVFTEGAVILGRPASMQATNPARWLSDTYERMTDQTIMMMTPEGDGLINQLNQKGEDFNEASIKALGMGYVERFTEMLGPYIGKTPGYVGRLLKDTRAMGYLQRTAVARWMSKSGIKTIADASRKAASKHLGWDGFFSEVIEEEIALPLQNMINGELPFKTTWAEQRDIATTVGIMSLFFGGIAKTARLIKPEQSIRYDIANPEGEMIERTVKFPKGVLDKAEELRLAEDFTIEDFTPIAIMAGKLTEEQKIALTGYIFGDRTNLLDKITKELESEVREREAAPAEEGVTGVFEEGVPLIEKVPKEEIMAKRVPFYRIAGEEVTEEQFSERLEDPEFKARVAKGEIDIKVENAPEDITEKIRAIKPEAVPEKVPPVKKEVVPEVEAPPTKEGIPEITEKERAEIDIFKKPETDFNVKYPDVTVSEGTPEGAIKEWIVPKKVTSIDIIKTEEVVDEKPVYQATVSFEDGSQVFKSTDRNQIENLANEIKEFKEEIKITHIEPEPEVEVMPERPEGPKEGEEVFSTDLYTVKKSTFDLDVISKETGKLTSPQRKKQIIEQYKEENIDKFTEGKETVIPETMYREDEVLRLVSEESENPAEVAISYIQALDIIEGKSDPVFDYISDNLSKFPMKSFVRFGDKVQLEGKKQIIPNYINNKGVYLDVQANAMSMDSGLDITPQDVIDFVMDNPSGSKAYLETESPLVGSLRDRFRELTGFEINEEYAKKLSERYTEKKVPKEEEGVTEFFSKIAKPLKKKKKPTKETRQYKKYKEERVERGKESGWASLGRPVDKSLNNMLDKTDRGESLPEDRKDFKISVRAKKVLEDLGIPVNEKLLSQKYLGVYKLKPQKVRVQALYDVTTVVHEGMHALDDRHGIADKILRDPTDKGLIRMLTDAYVEFYPDAKKSHPVRKRVVEGISSFVENYFYDPAYVDKNYSALIKTFIKTDGKYNNPEINKLLDDVNSIVEDYAKLESWQKMASRIRDGKEVVKNMKATGFNFFQRAVFQMFDKFEPLRRVAARAGVSETWDDPTIDSFNWMNKNTIIANWVKGKVMVLQKDGNWAKHDINVQKYVKMIKGKEKRFEAYLVSRRILSDHKKLSVLDALIKSEKDEVKILDLQEAYDERLKIIKKDDFNLTDATATVGSFEEEFKDATKIHDEIYSHILDFSVNTGILKEEIAEKFKQEDGYASFRRYIEDEIDGTVGTYNTKSMSKPSSFKKRTGGRLDVISPIYNQLNSINEILGKGLENILWQKVYKLAEKDVEIANRFEEVHYDQKGKPGTMKIFVHGVEKIIKPAPEFVAVAKSLRGREWNLFTKLLRLSSGWFTRATTAANPLFMLGNLPIDQLSALAQTKTGFIPGVDMIKNVPDYMKSIGKEGLFSDYLALGGRQQTFRAYYSMGPKDVIKEMQGGITKSERAAYKVKGIIEFPLHILEFPSNTSEYITRYAEFKRSVQKGESESVAMFRAAEITTPFQLEGEWFGGVDYIRSIPYFNATLQVSYKFYRSIRDNKARVATVGSALILLGIQLTIYMMRGSSDEQKRLLGNIPAKELARALYFPHPNGKDLLRVRIPEWFGAFSGIGALYVIQHYGGNKATMDNYIDAATSPIPDQFNILDPIQVPFAWMPQIMKPITQVITNTRTFPEIAPIVPQYKKESMPPEEIYSKYSTEVAKSIGELLEVSPTVIDFFIKNQFGTVVSMFAGNVPNNPLVRSEEKYQLAGRALNHFYKAKEEIKEDYNRIRFAEKEAEKTDREPNHDYSEEEVETIKFQRTFYDRVSDMIGDMRAVEKIISLPEEVREDNYQMILAIDNSEYDKAEELYIKLKNWADTTLMEITP